MRAIAVAAAVLLLLPLTAWASGGDNPPLPEGMTIGGPTVHASITLDPHEFGVTTTAKQGIMILKRHGKQPVVSAFNVPGVVPFFFGCDPAVTESRFVGTPTEDNPTPFKLVESFVVGADLNDLDGDGFVDGNLVNDVVEKLFARLGFTIAQPDGTAQHPVFTAVRKARCINDPNNPGPLVNYDFSFFPPLILPDPPPGPGILHFEADVRFLVPATP